MVYPVVLHLAGHLCLVVGAGQVAQRKVVGLLNAGAQVKVVGDVPTVELKRLADEKHIELHAREFMDSDLDGCLLVFATTDNPKVNDRVVSVAKEKGILFCHSAGGESNFSTPAVLSKGDLNIAVSTGGASPAYARFLRDLLAGMLAHEHAEALTHLKQARLQLKKIYPNDSQKRQRIWREVITKEMVETVQTGNLDAVQKRIDACISLSQD